MDSKDTMYCILGVAALFWLTYGGVQILECFQKMHQTDVMRSLSTHTVDAMKELACESLKPYQNLVNGRF